MSEKSPPRYRFSKKLGGGEFLNIVIWPGMSNPEDEVVSVQLRKFDAAWKTVTRISLYRTKEGAYSELQERGSKQTEGV
jgi:hypothetical protein